MDPHETILEELKRAQQRSLEAFTNRLDFVMESLESLIQEAKESVQEALPGEAEELFPTAAVSEAVAAAQLQVTAIENRAGQLMERIEDLEGRLSTTEAAAAEKQAAPVGLDLEVVRRLDLARSQSELLRELLPVLAEYGGRAVVLVLRDGRVSAWSGIGFADGESLRRWQATAESSEALSRLIHDGVPVYFAPESDPVFAEWLESEPATAEAILVPVSLRGRVVGGIYLDRAAERPWRPEAAQAAVAVACWLIDTLSLRATVPSPMVAEVVDLAVAEAAEPADEPTPAAGYPAAAAEPSAIEPPKTEEEADDEDAGAGEPATRQSLAVAEELEIEEEEPAVGAEDLEIEAEELETEAEEIEAEEAEIEEVAEAAEPVSLPEETPSYDPSATMRVEAPPADAEPVEAEDPAAAAEVPTADAAPGESMVPPPVQPVTPPPPMPKPEPEPELAGLSAQEQAQHEEARRFARLLVSEIKLYNEEEVDQGRRNHDLYKRLKEDIDRSREMFDRRVAANIREARDYFQEELVRILADGDADALGM